MPEPFRESDMSRALEPANLPVRKDVISRGEHCQNESFQRFSGGRDLCRPRDRTRDCLLPQEIVRMGVELDLFPKGGLKLYLEGPFALRRRPHQDM
jgi:hypothetical protein